MSITRASLHLAAASTLAGIAAATGAASLAIPGNNPVSKHARDTLRSISQQAFAGMASNMVESMAYGITAITAAPIAYPLTRSERKRQRRAQANREAWLRGWVAEWRTLGADPLEDRAARMEREPPEMHSWVVRQTSDNVRGALR